MSDARRQKDPAMPQAASEKQTAEVISDDIIDERKVSCNQPMIITSLGGSVAKARQLAAIKDRWRRPPAQKLGVIAGDHRCHREAVTDETTDQIKTRQTVGLTQNRETVGRYVISPAHCRSTRICDSTGITCKSSADMSSKTQPRSETHGAIVDVRNGDATDQPHPASTGKIQTRAQQHTDQRLKKRLQRFGREDFVTVRMIRQLDADHRAIVGDHAPAAFITRSARIVPLLVDTTKSLRPTLRSP